MFYRRSTLIFAFALSVAGCAAIGGIGGSGEVRVACIGDSITFGAGIPHRDENAYPPQLDRLLGRGWDVRNFGVSGATMLKSGNRPYWGLPAFAEALAFEPDIVIIQLGTNDSKPRNWDQDAFRADYREMVERFLELPATPEIYLCKPVPAYEERYGIRDSVIRSEVLLVVEEIAREKHLPVIDLYTALSGHPGVFPDGIHPDIDGSRLMAEAVVAALTSNRN